MLYTSQRSFQCGVPSEHSLFSLYYMPPAVLCFAPFWPSLASSFHLPGCFSVVNKIASVISKGLLQHFGFWWSAVYMLAKSYPHLKSSAFEVLTYFDQRYFHKKWNLL